MPSCSSPAHLGVLSRPKNLRDALLFKVVPKTAVCQGTCCGRGSHITCSNIHPHENGLVVEHDGHFLLNGIEPIDFKPTEIKELEVVSTETGKTILGWTINTRVARAIEHPWGALIISEEVKGGLVVYILATPQ